MRRFEKISREQWLKDTNEESRQVVEATREGDSVFTTALKYVDVYDNDIKLPQRSTSKSAGYDAYSPVHLIIPAHSTAKIPTGFKVMMEDDDVLFFIIRSSLATKKGIHTTNQVGVIDADYYNNPDNEGHCWICLENTSDKDFEINVGDKVSQLIFVKFNTTDDDEPLTDKRLGGFGSTGK